MSYAQTPLGANPAMLESAAITASGRMRRQPGQGRIDRFVLLGELGRGGMGVVYRARDVESGRDVALKVVLEGGLGADRLQRFRREGEVTASLNHPGIVRIHAAGEHRGLPYLAYELVEDCRSLERLLTDGAAPRAALVALVRDAARALGAAHALGVVHRDVKPENLLIDAGGRLRVADFGLATARDAERMTQTGALLGTPYYMAPEQFEARKGEVAPTVDVWALGVILYQALTSELPFGGASIMEVAAQIARAAPQPPRAHDRTVAPALEAVCLRALAPAPTERYPDGEALARDLDRALAGQAVEAAGGRGGRRRLRRLALFAAPAAAALLLAGVVVLSGRSEEPTHVSTGGAQDDSAATVGDVPGAPGEARPRGDTGANSAGASPSSAVEPAPRSAGDSSAARRDSAEASEDVTPLGKLLTFTREQLDPEERADDPGDAVRLGEPGFADHQYARLIERANPVEAVAYYRKAAEQGYTRAMHAYGLRLLRAEHVPEDVPEAFRWFERAGERGHHNAAHQAGVMRLHGNGCDRDPAAAAALLKIAAEGGVRDAMNLLAQMHEEGVGVDQDPEAAAEWRARFEATRRRPAE